jgi:toxin co-regulated pilus biosynthesis protein E
MLSKMKVGTTRHLSVQDRISFYDKCSSMLEEGISLFLAIQQMQDIAAKTRNKKKEQLYGKWLKEFKKGSKLEKIFKGYVPESELIVLAVAEKTGELVVAFKALSDIATLKQKIKNEVLAATLKPLFSVAVAIGVVVFFSIKVFPVFEQAIPLDKWPTISSTMYSMGKFFTSYQSIFMVLAILGFVLLLRYYCVYSKSPIRMKLDPLPPFCTHKSISATYFLQSLAVLLSSGVSLIESIKIIERNSKGWIEDKTEKMAKNIRKGQASHDIINVGLFDIETMADVAIFLERGNMGKNIAKIARRTEARLDKHFKKLATNINTAILALLAVLTGCIYYSIFMLTQLIGK